MTRKNGDPPVVLGEHRADVALYGDLAFLLALVSPAPQEGEVK